MASPTSKVTPLAPTLYGPRGEELIAKAASDFGVVGDAYADAGIVTAIGAEARAWQQGALRDAAIYYWLYRTNPWVRTCVDLIAQRATADSFSIRSLRGDDDPRIQAFETVLAQINPGQSLNRLLRGIYRDFQISGNWYARVQSKDGVPVAVYRLDFRMIVPIPAEVGPPQTYALYKRGRTDLSPEMIDAAEILHLTLNDSGERGMGLSPLESLDFTLALDQAAIAYNTGFFQNGAKAGDIYEMDPNLDPDLVEREREYLTQNFTKPSQSWTPMLLQGGTKLLRDGASLRRDMDFVKMREWNREEVTAVYSVPLSLITGQVGALGANGKEADNVLFKEAVIAPLQVQVFQDLNRELVVRRFQITDLELVPPKVAGIRLDLVQAAENLTHIGATGNEARAVVHLDRVDGLDEPLYLLPKFGMVGIPGQEDAILYTDKGAVSGRIQDPSEIAKTSAPDPQEPEEPDETPPSASDTPDDADGDGIAGDAGDTPDEATSKQARAVGKVRKAAGDRVRPVEPPSWFQKIVERTLGELHHNAATRRNRLTREIGGHG